MNQDVKDLWIKSLRSGEYKKTTGSLHRNTGFCCLGVLCDLYIKHMNNSANWINTENDILMFVDEHIMECSLLPYKVMEWAELTTWDGALSIPINNLVTPPGAYNTMYSLATVNDSGYTFPEIADIIEQQF